MAIGERIRFFRTLRGMTQKYLGIKAGFPERSADIRLAQYESGTRTPKDDLTATLAYILGVASEALTVPDIDTDIGLMHTLFTLEDLRGLKIDQINGEICLRLDKGSKAYGSMSEYLLRWYKEADALRQGSISKEDYDHWRYTYPKVAAERTRAAMDAQRLAMQAEADE